MREQSFQSLLQPNAPEVLLPVPSHELLDLLAILKQFLFVTDVSVVASLFDKVFPSFIRQDLTPLFES